ncbi:MAG: histidine phosphatase family protein [Burkholderiales bacterium]
MSGTPFDGPVGSRLWLVRHPRPDVPAGLCYGASDVPIVDAHLAELLDALPARLPRDAALYSSPLSRCLRLALGLHAAGFAAPAVDPRLRVMDFGRWEGRTWSEVPRDEIDAWRDDIERYVPPGGESVASLAARGLDFVATLPHPHEAIVVTHAGVIQTLARGLRRRPMTNFGGTPVAYGEIVALRHDPDGWTLVEP